MPATQESKSGTTTRKRRSSGKKIDLACGQNKRPGFIGIDIAGDADIIHDLFRFPWPLEDDSVREIYCSHFIEHLPHHIFKFENTRDVWFMFFDEVYRICRNKAKLTFIHPYVRNDRAFWDPTHVRFISEVTWYYLDKNWRKAQGLDHYPANHDFEVTLIEAPLNDRLMTRNPEYQQLARDTWWNAVGDLTVILKARK